MWLSISFANKNSYILFKEVNIWMRLLSAEGNCLSGDWRMLKIMIVEKAIVASILFWSCTKVTKVRKMISGQLVK